MAHEIIHKPTFTNQLLALPQKVVLQVLDKVRLLAADPAPDAKNKKRLVGYATPVFRLRAGDYRILYTFGEGWVSLLGVDARKDVYRGAELVAEGPGFDVETTGAVGDLAPVAAPSMDTVAIVPAPGAVPTPHAHDAEFTPPDAALLARLRVPEEHHAALLACRTLDDLVVAPVPDAVRERVFDVLTTPDYGRVLAQPSFVTGDVDDLLKFAEGELLGFLLKLNPEQERLVPWGLNAAGPTLVKGGPGTGKSTVAMYRARAMVAALRAAGVAEPRILFTTYTNALVTYSRQLLDRLLGPDAACVEVRTADNLVMEIVRAFAAGESPRLADTATLRDVLAEAKAAATLPGNTLTRKVGEQTLARLTPDYLLEELTGVIAARELDTLEAYRTAARTGRQVPLNATQRGAVWAVWEAFRAALARRGLETWAGLRRRALDHARTSTPAYDGVIVDEAQDLDATVLRLLVAGCRATNRLFVTADANQSIYGGGYRWTDVHADLQFRGRTGVLRTNHRTTREIGEAAHAYLREGTLDADDGPAREYVANGPAPAVRSVPSAYDEAELLARFLPDAARAFRLGLGACAVLVPTEGAGKAVAARLVHAGVRAVYMPGQSLDLEATEVKVITLKSAKGLEFPVVAVAGFADGIVPGAARGASDEERDEAERRERRTFYVAMTRAMRALLVLVPTDHPSSLFAGFDAALWNTGAGNTGAAPMNGAIT